MIMMMMTIILYVVMANGGNESCGDCLVVVAIR